MIDLMISPYMSTRAHIVVVAEANIGANDSNFTSLQTTTASSTACIALSHRAPLAQPTHKYTG